MRGKKLSALHSASSCKYHFRPCNCYGQPYENDRIVFILSLKMSFPSFLFFFVFKEEYLGC